MHGLPELTAAPGAAQRPCLGWQARKQLHAAICMQLSWLACMCWGCNAITALLTMVHIVRAVQRGVPASAQQWLMACLACSREVHLRVHVSSCHHQVKWWGSTSSPGSARGRGGRAVQLHHH